MVGFSLSRGRLYILGSAYSALGTGVALVSLLLVGKMATNALSAEAVAIFMLTLMLADGLNLLSNFGLFATAPKLFAEQSTQEARWNLTVSLLAGQFFASIAVALPVLAAASQSPSLAPMLGLDASLLRMSLLWSLPLFVLGACRDTLLAAMAGANRYGAHTAASVLLSAGQAALVFGLVWLGDASVFRMLLSVSIAQVAGVLLLLYFSWSGTRAVVSLADYRAAVGFSFPLHVNALLNFVFQRLDSVLVTLFLGLPATALYEIAKRFPQVLSRILNALLLPWLPIVTGLLGEGRRVDAGRALSEVLCVVTALGYASILIVTPFAEGFVLLVAADDYTPAAPLLPWLMTGILMAVQAGVFGQTLVAMGTPLAVTAGNVVQAIVSLGWSVVLLPDIGLAGMGYAWCMGTALSLLIQGGAVWRLGLTFPMQRWLLLHVLFLAGALSSQASLAALNVAPIVIAILILLVILPLVQKRMQRGVTA